MRLPPRRSNLERLKRPSKKGPVGPFFFGWIQECLGTRGLTEDLAGNEASRMTGIDNGRCLARRAGSPDALPDAGKRLHRTTRTGLADIPYSLPTQPYSVPCEWINSTVSLRAYPAHLLVVATDGECVTLKRSFERDQTIYDWTHYISLFERKPGAL